MGFKLNNQNIQVPDSHHWVNPKSVGTGGDGHTLYGGLWSYEFTWPAMPAYEYEIIRNIWLANSVTGSVTASLPDITTTGSSYSFKDYAGCLLQMPEYGSYFEGTYNTVKLVINHVQL